MRKSRIAPNVNLNRFHSADEFAPHRNLAAQLIDPNYESGFLPDDKENLNGAFRAATDHLPAEYRVAMKEILEYAYLLGLRDGMSSEGVYFDPDPKKTQWCQGSFHERILTSLNYYG